MSAHSRYLNALGAIDLISEQVGEKSLKPDFTKLYSISRNALITQFQKSKPGRTKLFLKKAEIPKYIQGECELRDSIHIEQVIQEEGGCDVFNFIQSFVDIEKNHRSILLNTKERAYLDGVDFENLRAIVNIHEINFIADLNEYNRIVNTLLPDGGIFIGKVHTYIRRNKEKQKKYGKFFGNVKSLADFMINRVMPKMKPLDNLYRYITKNKYHIYSKAEVLGRMVYYGFEIIDCQEYGRYTYFACVKTREISPFDKKPSYYPLFKMQRVGKDGKLFGVYKLRTMHPYSEFIQDYVIKTNGYNDKGKPANDFRVTPWGKWMRRLWLDEAPQIINLLKGDMKIVGVRPLSEVRFKALPEEVQKARIKHKPGCFPPYVALCMPDEEQNIEAEIIYMKEKEKNPYTTDIKYLAKSVYNILTNKIRSA